MARPAAKELTERELQIMQLFWKQGEMTAAEARDALAGAGLDLAYTTVATLVKILVDKEFLQQTNTRAAVSLRAGPLVRGCLGPAVGGPGRARV